MKKLVLFFVVVIGFIACAFAATEIREVARDWKTSAVSVSTFSVTSIPTAALSGRYRIVIENTDPTYDVSIGTFSAFTYANGFVLKYATSTIAIRDLPLTSGATVYGLGQANATQLTVNVRLLEFK